VAFVSAGWHLAYCPGSFSHAHAHYRSPVGESSAYNNVCQAWWDPRQAQRCGAQVGVVEWSISRYFKRKN